MAGEIHNGMKGILIGEHTFTIEEPCPLCSYHLDEHYDDVECLCDGDGIYEKEVVVPWATAKEIYKDFAKLAVELEKIDD